MKGRTFIALTALLVARSVFAQPAANPKADWDRQAAAAYLDHRMDEWFANGARLATGEGRTVCVSCHTVVPYALARPALRRAAGVAAPTPHEVRLVEETSRRVETFGEHQLLYDFDEGKKGESRGTEAVLYALILAAADQAAGTSEPSDATRRAMSHLWRMQRDDGAWEWLDVGLEPFESIDSAYFGAACAALAAAMTPALADEPAARTGMVKLRSYLRASYSLQNLHNRVWGLLASASIGGVLTEVDRDQLVEDLRRVQHADGGWALPELGVWRWNRVEPPFESPGPHNRALASRSDGYATGLAVYALRRAGVPIEHPVVGRALEWLRANQLLVRDGDREWSAWRAHSLNYDREHAGPRGEPWRRLFMSDAATAFASLALTASE